MDHRVQPDMLSLELLVQFEPDNLHQIIIKIDKSGFISILHANEEARAESPWALLISPKLTVKNFDCELWYKFWTRESNAGT